MSGAQSVGGVITFARQYTHAETILGETILGYTTRLSRMEPPEEKISAIASASGPEALAVLIPPPMPSLMPSA